MRKVLVVVLAGILCLPPAASAAPQSSSVGTAASAASEVGLRAAAIREARRLALVGDRMAFQSEPTGQPRNGSWIRRHPALFGAAVGAGAGMVVAASNTSELFCTGNDEDCLAYGSWGVAFGAAAGAGIGALVGHVLGRIIGRNHERARADTSARR